MRNFYKISLARSVMVIIGGEWNARVGYDAATINSWHPMRQWRTPSLPNSMSYLLLIMLPEFEQTSNHL